MVKRAEIIRDRTQIVSMMMAHRVIEEAQKQHNKLGETEMKALCMLAPSCSIIAYSKKEGWRKYELVGVKKNSVYVVLPSGRVSTMPFNFVRPFYKDIRDNDIKETLKKAMKRRLRSGQK